MIRLEFDEFSIDVPIERRMSVEEFLAVADKLERISGRTHFAAHAEPVALPPPPTHHAAHTSIVPSEPEYATSHAPSHDDMRFEHEDAQRLEYFMDRLARQLAKLEETHVRLERIERAMVDHGIHPKR